MKKYLMMIVVASTVISSCIFAHAPAASAQDSQTLATVLQKVMPAIVNVSVEKTTLTDLNKLIPTNDKDTKVPVQTIGVGSGVIFDANKGLIVTNAHVIEDQQVIIVTLKDGQRYHAKVIAKSKDYDLAILAIQAPHLTQLSFGNSDKLAVGHFVTAIGSPYGLSQTVTSGIVSALNRTHPQIEGYQSFIQTDAPINPGNSGGALINTQGELVGINTAIIGPNEGNIGIGFAIPSNIVFAALEQLLTYGKVEHGVLGVTVQNITPELADAFKLPKAEGALVSQVTPNTPAAIAGLQIKDVITSVNNHPILNGTQLRNIMGLTHPGTRVRLVFLRDGSTKSVVITVADPKAITATITPYFAGMRLQEITELEKEGRTIRGLLITQVAEESTGALAGLTAGDVITEINGKPTPSISALETLSEGETKPLVLTVLRDTDQTVFLVLDKQ